MRRLLFSLFLLFPSLLNAQTGVGPEVMGRAGIVQLWDDEGNIGTGPALAGGVGVRLPGGFGAEALVERHTNERHFTSGVSFDSHALAVTGRILKYVGRGNTRPYFGGGAGVTRITTRSEFPGLSEPHERTTTSPLLSGFAGVRIDTRKGVFFRPEFDFSKAGEHLRMAGTVAVGFGW